MCRLIVISQIFFCLDLMVRRYFMELLYGPVDGRIIIVVLVIKIIQIKLI